MRKPKTKFFNLSEGPLTRHNLQSLIAKEKKTATTLLWFQVVILFTLSALIFISSAFFVISNFYNAPIPVSKRSWIQIRNLTPIVPVGTRANGILEKVFVSQGQLVQKGALLGAVQTSSIALDYEDNRRAFADKVVELHCLASLQAKKSVFKMPYEAQILIDQVLNESDSIYRIEQCNKELLRNITADQSLEETIAALEDQSRLFENIAKMNRSTNTTSNPNSTISNYVDGSTIIAIEDVQEIPEKTYRNEVLPVMQLAQVRQELQEARKEYFSMKLQKEDELATAIEQTAQDMRYLDKRLRELSKQFDENFIYASITGTVLDFNSSIVGTYFKGNDTVFKLQPIDNVFQISITLDEEDSARFKIGTPITISLEETAGELKLTTAAVIRKPNGTLEAIMNSVGNSKNNANAILAAGYRGEGEQRLFANITSGQKKAWQSIRSIVLNNPALGSI